jgi:UDP-N-acetyl-D-mannosaminuronate dehydrogenase
MNGVSVFGLGPVRLPVFVAIFKAGFDIIAVEISAERVWDILLRSVPGDDSSLEGSELDQIEATTGQADVVPERDVVLVCLSRTLNWHFTTGLLIIEALFGALVDTISPAEVVWERLIELGADVDRYVPFLPSESLVETPSVEGNPTDPLTDHPEFAALNCERLVAIGVELVYGARNVVDEGAVSYDGMTYAILSGITEPR